MKIFPVSILIILLFTQCQHKSKRILFDYVNTDSVINYKIYHDSLVLTFPDKTQKERWIFEIEISSRDTTMSDFPIHFNSKSYHIINNKIVVPLAINNSIDLKKLKLSLLAGQPDDGLHFTKAYNYGYPKNENLYEMEGNQVFFSRDSSVPLLITPPYTRNWKWYVIPDTLFTGKDSTFYLEQFVLFERDSMPRTSFPQPQ